MKNVTTTDYVALVNRWRNRVARHVRCPEIREDVLQAAAIRLWRAESNGTEITPQLVSRCVSFELRDAARSDQRRTAVAYQHVSAAEMLSAAEQVAPEAVGLDALTGADPQDVADALAYVRGEIERTPAARKAQERRLARIREATGA